MPSTTGFRTDLGLDTLPSAVQATSYRLRPGRRGEDGVGSDAAPDDVGLPSDPFLAVGEGRASVVVPCHLEYAPSRTRLNPSVRTALASRISDIDISFAR